MNEVKWDISISFYIINYKTLLRCVMTFYWFISYATNTFLALFIHKHFLLFNILLPGSANLFYVFERYIYYIFLLYSY